MKSIVGLDEKILNLDGQVILDESGLPLTVKKTLANLIARSQSDDAVGAMKIALDIYNAKDKIELEDADAALVKEIVSSDKLLNNLAKATLLKSLEY